MNYSYLKKFAQTANKFNSLLCRILRKEVHKTRKKILISKTKKGPKEFWQEVNKLRGCHSSQIHSLSINGAEVRNDQVIADRFADFFVNKVNDLLGSYEPHKPPLLPQSLTSCPLFTEQEVSRSFDRLSNKKSAGMDSLSGFFIKIFKSQLINPLMRLFNLVLEGNPVPATWKIAKIFPVHKKGPTNLVENYRPVSNIISIAKLFELCLLQRIEAIDQDETVGYTQHGFRKRHSTTSAVVELVDNICEAKEDGNVVAVYSADLTAAFDILRKEKLVEIMKAKEFPDYIILAVHNYLENRSGYVQLNDSRSCVKDIRAGCVQGSILGPYLFNIYTSDLNKVISPCSLTVYADDSYVMASACDKETLVALLEITLQKHFEWLQSVGMICNLSKTELIGFGLDELEVNVGNVRVVSKEQVKVLGITLDNKLNWEFHIRKVIAKCRSFLFPLRYIRKQLNANDTIKILKAQLVSVMTYGSPCWSASINYSQRARLRSVYFQAIRTVLRDFNFNLNRTLLLRKSGMESIDDILFKRISTFIFSIYYYLEPTNLAGRLLSRGYFNERQSGQIMFFDLSRTKFGRRSLLNRIREFTHSWSFEWTGLNPMLFKSKLKTQFQKPV